MQRLRFRALLLLLVPMSASFLNPVLAKRVQDAQTHLERAMEFALTNDMRAEKEFRLALQARDGSYPEALQQFSRHLARNQRFSEAALYLDSYIKQIPEEEQAYELEDLAKFQYAAGLQEAIRNSEKPELNHLLEFASLVIRYGSNGLSDSLPYLEQAVRLYPGSADALVALAASLINSNQTARRYEILRDAIQIDPTNARAHFWLGHYYNSMFQGEQAVEEFKKALELSNGELGEAWQGLGWGYLFQGNRPAAAAAFRRYIESGSIPATYVETIIRMIRDLESVPKN